MWKSKLFLLVSLLVASAVPVKAEHALPQFPNGFCAPEVCNAFPYRQWAPTYYLYQPMRRFWVIIRWGNQWLFYPAVQPAFPSVAVISQPGALPLSYY